MSTTAKILIFVGMFLTLVTLGFIVYNQHQLSVQQSAIQNEQIAQRQLIDGVVRSQTSWATQQDIANLLAANGVNADALKAIQHDMDNVKANLTTANIITVNSKGQNVNNQASTGTGPANPKPPTSTTIDCPNGGSVTCPASDPFGYMQAQQEFQLNEDFGTIKVPIGTVGFSAFQDKPWSANIYARQYTVDNVIGTDENQRNVVYNQVNIKEGSKTYTIPITTSTTKQVLPSAKFSFWNPRILIGVDGGINLNYIKGEFSPSLSLGVMSYGQFKTTPDLSVLEVGVAYQAISKRPALVLTPIAYNFGRNFFSPLMNNTYIAPSVMISTDGTWTLGAGLRVGF